MGSAHGSGAVADQFARRAGGVVSRPELFGRLGGPARVTVVSAPPGSGKTVLLRSWIDETDLTGRVAWVPAGRDERDPQRFWPSVLGALRETAPASLLVGKLTAAPDLDGWAIAERLLTDLVPLEERIWLVVDDVHELGPDQALRQLELLLMRGPPELRFVLATRHDVRLGLHRLRLEGELSEIREPDLRFTLDEARELLQRAGVQLPEPTLALLYERTEGWAAGLRLAALSLAGHPDAGRFAAEFSGSERTVAEYLLAEVLERQSPQVRRLLLRTSVLERVNGELADLLTGGSGGERVLQDLQEANAFVVALDAPRSWFRYHRLFADLLQLELRRSEPGEVTALHRVAAGWFAGQGQPVEAVRHAQAARDWRLAARLLTDHWSGFYLEGQAVTAHQLLSGIPAEVVASDPEATALVAADELSQGSLEAAERYQALAARGAASVPAGRRERLQSLVGIVRLWLAKQRGNAPAVADEAQRLRAVAEAADVAQLDLGAELRALALISLGGTEASTAGFEEAERDLHQGVDLARRAGRPYLEFIGLAYLAAVECWRSFGRAADRSMQVIELARRHGWTDKPFAAIACQVLGAVLAWQGKLDEAELWAERAEQGVRAESEPAVAAAVHNLRGLLELARGRDADALAAFRASDRLAQLLATPHGFLMPPRAWLVHALVCRGETERAERALAELGEQDRGRAEIRTAQAALQLARHDPHAASAALAPVLDGSAPVAWRVWQAQAFLLEAIAKDALGDPAAAGQALESALDLTEPDGALVLFLLHRASGLLERHAHDHTAHAALIAEIRSLLAGHAPTPRAAAQPPLEPLSDSEIRVLRYLPTNLSMPDIANELCVSHNTIRTHARHLYAKLGSHRRADTVARARALGLLAPSPLKTRPTLGNLPDVP
jgi:LuxR family transcriptional regulator, maltose regulon positive regulatory protein